MCCSRVVVSLVVCVAVCVVLELVAGSGIGDTVGVSVGSGIGGVAGLAVGGWKRTKAIWLNATVIEKILTSYSTSTVCPWEAIFLDIDPWIYILTNSMFEINVCIDIV